MPLETEAGRDRDRDRSTNEPHQIQNLATYHTPITAMFRGRAVKIVATGDAPGHSAVCQYVDEQGRLVWAEQDRFTVIDATFLPPSLETLRDATRNLSNR